MSAEAEGNGAAGRAVVIGGGSNGTWMSVYLAELPAIREIVLIDRDGQFGRGVAYSATADWHRLNVPADKMGGRSEDDPSGFASWLAQTGHHIGPDYSDGFVPRRLYGDYLCAQLDAVHATGRLTLLRDAALAVERQSGNHVVRTASGRAIEAATVVLCLGNPPPAQIRGLMPAPRLIADIWRPGALDSIGPDDDVIVVGTGATAVDAVLDLVHRGKARRIRLVSRQGRLPLVDVPASDCDPVDDVPLDTARGMLAGLRAAVARRAGQGIPWQAVVDSFRVRAAEIWQGLSDVEKGRFLRHLRSLWFVHRHRLAPDVADFLERLRAEGRIEVMTGRVRAGEQVSEAYALLVQRNGASGIALETLDADWVLNCTGPDENLARNRAGLVGDLLETGLARPGPFGLGLDCDLRHRLADASGQPQAGLYLVGPPTRGRFWEVTPAPNGRNQCTVVAKEIAATLGSFAASAPST
ncbi:FAD/NAD(P)-binding protein [Bosea sp. 117]|uniref:FAD/NAD(P)-binding protein n=1 Tax=Bosea sp. 117 TaxID=1125973 RepID=UPI0004940A3A|nr:FAD/NAD(P)-binding protein [Bosea sp. 117]